MGRFFEPEVNDTWRQFPLRLAQFSVPNIVLASSGGKHWFIYDRRDGRERKVTKNLAKEWIVMLSKLGLERSIVPLKNEQTIINVCMEMDKQVHSSIL